MNYNPSDVYIKIKKLEFKFLLLPLVLIIANFIIVYFYHYTKLKYLSLLLLIIYFFIKFLFRIDRIDVPNSGNTLKTPVSGTIVNIENDFLIIKKRLWDKSDIRYSLAEFTFTKGLVFIFSKVKVQSVLIGVVPGIAICKVVLPENYKFTATLGQKVISGVTDIGNFDEKH